MKIGHWIPSYRPPCDQLTMQTHVERTVLEERLGYEYRLWTDSSTDIKALRNGALEQAMEWGLDYLCMQDSDIYSKSSIGAISIMLETARTKDATQVAAICGLRRYPHQANVQPFGPDLRGTVYEAEKCGTGLVLIDVKAVASWDYEDAWFDQIYNRRGTKLERGEDIFFSKLVREMGGKLFVDGRVPTTHILADHRTLDYPGAAAARSETQETAIPAETGNA